MSKKQQITINSIQQISIKNDEKTQNIITYQKFIVRFRPILWP